MHSAAWLACIFIVVVIVVVDNLDEVPIQSKIFWSSVTKGGGAKVKTMKLGQFVARRRLSNPLSPFKVK